MRFFGQAFFSKKFKKLIMFSKLVKELIDKFILEFKKNENQDQLKIHIIDPIICYIFDRLYPYIFITSAIFVILFLILISILFLLIKKP